MKRIKLMGLATATAVAVSLLAGAPASASDVGGARSSDVVAIPAAGEIRSDREFQVQAGPLLIPVVVWAITCAAGGLIAAGGTDWDDPDAVAWGVAGIIVGCIPGVATGSIVKVILANKGAVANALKLIGLTGPAAILTGDSAG